MGVLGLEGRLFLFEGGCTGLFRRDALHARDATWSTELSAMVQHGPPLGIRYRRAEPGSPLRGLQDRQADQVRKRLRASAAPRVLHSVLRRRPCEQRWHHGSVGPGVTALQVRVRHRDKFQPAPRSGRASVRRRQVIGPDGLSEDRRPCGRCHQVGRHHPARGQDGDR